MIETKIFLKRFARLVRSKAGERNLNRLAVMNKTGLSSAVIYELWNDEKTDIKVSSIFAITEALDITPDEFKACIEEG